MLYNILIINSICIICKYRIIKIKFKLSKIYIMYINWEIILKKKMFALFMGIKLNDTRDFKVNTNKPKEKKLE